MKISGQLLSSKPVSLSRAAKLLTRFAAFDNGSSATVSLYLQRTADAFNHLVQSHNKLPKNSDVEISPDRKKARKLEADKLEENPDEKTANDSKSRRKRKRDKKSANEVAETTNPTVDEVKDLKMDEKKKKKKKRKSDDVDLKEKSKMQRIVEGVDL